MHHFDHTLLFRCSLFQYIKKKSLLNSLRYNTAISGNINHRREILNIAHDYEKSRCSRSHSDIGATKILKSLIIIAHYAVRCKSRTQNSPIPIQLKLLFIFVNISLTVDLIWKKVNSIHPLFHTVLFLLDLTKILSFYN